MNKLKNSKIILVLSVLLLFLVIGSASAVDETNNETISTPENNGVDTLSQSMDSVDDEVSAAEPTSDLVVNDTSNNKLLGLSNDESSVLKASSIDVSTYDDLYDAINNGGYSEINIIDNLIMTKNLPEIKTNNLVIDGHGNTLNGNNKFITQFEISGNNNIIKNFNFINYYSSSSGTTSVVHINAGYNNSISNCNFSNICKNSTWGSTIFIGKHANPGPVNTTIESCRFIDCGGDAGGAIYTGWDSSVVQIYNCDFNHCYRPPNTLWRGSIMELKSNYTSIVNCTFSNCDDKGASTTSVGGGIDLLGGKYFYMFNCTFVNNSAFTGAAIYAEGFDTSDAVIANCTFINNVATRGNSGALVFNGQNALIENCTFVNNSATNNGGALVFNAPSGKIVNCTFINNTATKEGGAVYFAGTNCNIINCNFIGNTAKEGGAVKFNANDSYMGYCTYINNTATKDGGALCSQANGSVVELCDFENNTAPIGRDFYGHNIPIEFRGMSFTSLWLINSNHTNKDQIVMYGYGTDASTPAIWDENALGFLKKNVHCTIYLVDTINNLTQEVLNVPDLEIVGHDPTWNPTGGVVDLSNWNHRAFTVNASDVKFTNLTFKNANITDNGGVLRIINDAAVIDNCTFMNNTACNGSAISFEKGVVLIIRDSTFINNTALGNGTVYMYDDANSTMTFNSTFMDNTAYLGSAIYYAGPVWYYADGLTLTNLINANETNKDLYNGSLPYWENNTKIFTGFNESPMLRAKLCLMDVYVNLAGYGGVHNGTRDDPTDIAMAFQMVAPTGTIHFVNSSEIWNMSKLYSSNESVNYKFGVTFEGNNTTSTDYKFINSVYGYDVTISDFHIINTDTCVEWKARNGTIINSSFTSKDHVAFNLTGENLTICDSSFTGNGNGALYVDASGLVLSNCTFNNNNISSGVGSHIVLTENANNTRIIDSRFIKGNNTGVLVNATGVSISGSNFTDNTGINGGALILSNGTLVLSDNNFTRNIVSGNGGALLLSNGNLSMSGNNFTYNKADVDGGAVYLENGTLEDALGNDFWHNRAGNNGGALYTNIPVVMDGGVFFNNTADVCGGGIYLNNTNNTLSNMEFNNNTAVNGSAIYVTENNTLNVNNVVLKGNTHTDFTNIDETRNYGSIYLSNYLSEGLFKDSGLVLGDLQDIWDGTYRLPVIYVNSTGTSRTGGASPETATSLDNALNHLIDGGKIIFTTNYDIDDMVNLTNRNLTLTSNNSSSIIRKDSTGKYLFNQPKKC